MGWRYRKSINLGGGFRINLSKSGIGYSWGFPGYRHTYKANGSQRKTYSIPGTGISYVEESGGRSNKYRNNSNENLNYNQNTKLITGDTEYYQNLNISKMGKDDEILKQISKLRTIDIVANICLISIYLIPIGIILKLLIAYKWKIDLTYEMDDINKKKFEHLNNFLIEISKNNKIWQVGSSTMVYNTKYNAGAGNNITRHKVSILKKMPWYISHNIDVYCLNLTGEKIYFTPDRMLIFKKLGGVGSRKYNDMVANFSYTNFVETEFVPRDTEIIRYTWRYVNKSGGPDKRFNNNRQIPVCKYGELSLETSDGINILLECSNHKLMQGIQDKFMDFMKCHNKIISMTPDTTQDLDDIYEEQLEVIEEKSDAQDKWNVYNNDFETESKENIYERKQTPVVIEPTRTNGSEDDGKKNLPQENNTQNNNLSQVKKVLKIICNILSYIWVFISSIVVIACISDKMFLAMILWLSVAIIFIPKVKEKINEKNQDLSKNIILVRMVLIIIAFIVLGLTIPNPFEGTWKSENNSIIIISKDSIEMIFNDETYEGTYKYNSLEQSSSNIIHYEINVEYTNKANLNQNILHYYSDDKEKYICIYDNNQCIEYFKFQES